MNWLCTCSICDWMVVYSNLAKNELNFIFAKISFGMKVKRQRTLAGKRDGLVGWETTNNGSWIAINMKLNGIFGFGVNYT